MCDRLDVKIDVEVRPIEVVWLRTLDMEDPAHGCVSEPGEVLECEEVLRLVQQQPEAVGRDPKNLNG